MKILLFNEYTAIHGGIDYVVNLEYKYLAAKGVDVNLFSFHNKQFYDSSFYNKAVMVYKSLSGKLLLNNFQNYIYDYKPEIIHFHNVYQLFRTPIWTKINPYGAKIILHLHNYYPFCNNSFFYNKKGLCTDCLKENNWSKAVLNKCYNNSYCQSFIVSSGRIKASEWVSAADKVSKLIAVSRYISEIYAQAGVPKDKLIILPNPVERLVQMNNSTNNYVLFLGNIRTEKGIDLVCKAAEDNKKIKFIIAGDGPCLNHCRRKYKKVNNIEFKGYTSGRDKADLLTNARFLVVPSLCGESFSMVTMEAYAAGTPVLSSGRGAAGELIKAGITGKILTEQNASKEISDFWNELNKNRQIYSDNCRVYAEEYYADTHAEKLLSIYKNTLLE